MTLAPTTLTGVSRSRSPPEMASMRRGTFSGNISRPCHTWANIWPV